MSTGLVVVALGLGIFSAIIQVTMNWAQRSVSPTRATVIYTGEPVWADFRPHGRRALPLLALVGAAFIVAGVLVSERKLKRKKNALPENDSAALNQES
jgi:drug/metabolite transporter (DMT)-like permease